MVSKLLLAITNFLTTPRISEHVLDVLDVYIRLVNADR